MGINKVQYGNTVLIDLTDTTAVASDVAAGKYFYGKDGVKTLGTGSGGGGGSVTQDQDGYIILPSTGGGSPSATQHTIYFEFTDSTDATINAWYDSSFISDAITATEPTTYGQKTVDSASLDGVTWYTRPTTQWETLLDDTVQVLSGDPYNSFWISDLASVYPTVGSVWRITLDSVVYICTAVSYSNRVIVGNPLYAGGEDDGSGVPFYFANRGWGAWSGDCSTSITGDANHALKVERQISA